MDREHRPTERDRASPSVTPSTARDGVDPGPRQAARGSHPAAAVLLEQERGHAIRREEHRGVIGEPIEDLVEVEATADVARDPAEGVGALQLVGDLGGGRRRPDDGPDGRRRDADQLAVRLGQSGSPVPEEEQDTPAIRAAGDRAGDLAARLIGCRGMQRPGRSRPRSQDPRAPPPARRTCSGGDEAGVGRSARATGVSRWSSSARRRRGPRRASRIARTAAWRARRGWRAHPGWPSR